MHVRKLKFRDPYRAKPVSVLSVIKSSSIVFTTEHTEAASRHTEDTELRGHCPLSPTLSVCPVTAIGRSVCSVVETGNAPSSVSSSKMNPTCYNPRKENDVQKQQHRVIETKEAYKGTICFRRPLTKNSNPRKTETDTNRFKENPPREPLSRSRIQNDNNK